MEQKLPPPPLHELRKRSKPVRNVYTEHKEKVSQHERIAMWITEHIGTMGFLFIIGGWTTTWLGWNIFAPPSLRFDSHPFFLWLFIANLLQVSLMPLIMIGQNLQSRHLQAKAEADFELDMKSELEIENILEHLEYQNDLIREILMRMKEE